MRQNGDLSRVHVSVAIRAMGESVCYFRVVLPAPIPCSLASGIVREWRGDNIKLRYLFPVACLEHIRCEALGPQRSMSFSRHTRFGAYIVMAWTCIPG